MTKEDLIQVIKDTVQPEIGAAVKASVDEAVSKFNPTVEKEALKDIEGKFPRFGNFLSAVKEIRQNGRPDNRLIFVDSKGQYTKPVVQSNGKATLVEGTDSAGGFLVPEEFRAQIFASGLETAVVRNNNPMVVPMTSDTLRYPRIVDTAHTSSVHGGIVGYWTGEGKDLQESEPTFGDITLTAKKLTGYTKVSEELLQDSAISLEPFLRRQFGEAWAWFEDLAFLRGTGSGQPLGILNAAALISVTRQDTDNALYKDVTNMWSRMTPDLRGRAVWVANHELYKELLFMNAANTVTNAYGAQTSFIANLNDPVKAILMGRPLIFSEKMSALADAGDFAFYDFGSYLIGDRQSLTIDMSGHVYWTTGYVAFKFTERVDGQPIPSSAMTPYKGTDTLSPFVALGASS